MKVPKQLVRSDSGKTLERAYKVCIVNDKAERVYAGPNGYVLPDGARWATEDDAEHDEVRDAMALIVRALSARG